MKNLVGMGALSAKRVAPGPDFCRYLFSYKTKAMTHLSPQLKIVMRSLYFKEFTLIIRLPVARQVFR